jgi:mRNA interferase RelE/StbE
VSRIILMPEAREDYLDLDGSAQRQVAKGLAKLTTEPEKRGQPLGRRIIGDLTNFRKLVVGDRAIRIIYQVRPNGDIVVVWVIAKRADDEAYQLAMARIQLHGDPAIRSLAATLGELWEP